MPVALPEGEPAPSDGTLPAGVWRGAGGGPPGTRPGPLGIYLHVPYCLRRCGYCDFNTYTLAEAGSAPTDFLDAAVAELDLARRVLTDPPPVATVFFGGGTPTMLPAATLVSLLRRVADRFGLDPDAEITTEANPDTLDPAYLQELAAGGFTRVSLGMQSAKPHVLAVLDRTHRHDNVAAGVAAARAAGLATSVDLIYGTPGESLADWADTVRSAVALEPDHVSAYALVVEDGTALAARVSRGELPGPDDDDEAAKYELADRLLTEAGYAWYEVSNWARRPQDACRHNLAYWDGAHWWGIGPGAHSHVGGVRWWNVKNPATYVGRLARGESPAAAREILTGEQRYAEGVLLQVRLSTGLAIDDLEPAGRESVAGLIADGLVDAREALAGRRLVPTLRGRLLIDTIVHRLLP